MNKRTLKALQDSIKKWEMIRAGELEDEGCLNCPLCTLFHSNTGRDTHCEGCPVKEKSGKPYCFGTPYTKWQNLCLDNAWFADTPQKKAQATREITFLKSLLP